MIDRSAYLNSILGKPWERNSRGPDTFDCYQLVCIVQHDLFGRVLPVFDVPEKTSWSGIIRLFSTHPERNNWKEVPHKTNSVVKASDGAVVFLGATTQEAHIGVWFKPEGRILHCSNPDGVTFQDIVTLRALGWHKIAFYEPV